MSELNTMAASAAPTVPALDLLEVSAPAAAPAGNPVELLASLTRSGAPVPGATVEFWLTGRGASRGLSSSVQAVTGEDGIARVAVPAEAAGVSGSRSTVSAITPDGKAVGVRGTIPVSSAEVSIAWQ